VPTFIIGNKMVVGAQPYEALERVVKEELIKA
jgi:predicted DsbA family dithiol-disulfide isomerase